MKALGAIEGSGSARLWWIVNCSTSKAKGKFHDAVSINDQLGVDAANMKEAFNDRWTQQFTKAKNIGVGFVCRDHYNVPFVTVCPDGDTRDSPANGIIIREDDAEWKPILETIESKMRQSQRGSIDVSMNSNTELSLPTHRECIDTDSANVFATRKRPRSVDRCEILP